MRSDQSRAGAASRPAPARPAPEPVPLPTRYRPPRGVRTIDGELDAIAAILGHPVTRDDACTALRAARPDLAILADPETLGLLRDRHLDEITAVIRAHLLGPDAPLRRLTCPDPGCGWTSGPFPAGAKVPDWAAVAASVHDYYAHGPGRTHLERRQAGLPLAWLVAGYLVLVALLALAGVGLDLLGERLGWWG